MYRAMYNLLKLELSIIKLNELSKDILQKRYLRLSNEYFFSNKVSTSGDVKIHTHPLLPTKLRCTVSSKYSKILHKLR